MNFTEEFNKLSDEDRESLLKNLFMIDDSAKSAEIRKNYYAEKLRHMGENVQIGKNVKIINPQYVSIGDNSIIGDDVTIIARGEKGVTIGNYVGIQERVYLDTERTEGYITIGDFSYIGTGTTLFGHVGLEIGEYCLLAQGINLTPYSHIFENPNTEIIKQGGHCTKVTIGRDTYIGMGVTIMYSGSIGEGSVIGSGSNVVKPIPPYSVAVGNPAKVIRKRTIND